MNFIKAQIKGQDYTYEQIAKALGLSRVTLLRRIQGQFPWSIEEANKLCEFLGIDSAIFFRDYVDELGHTVTGGGQNEENDN